jgi:hypothetical protein
MKTITQNLLSYVALTTTALLFGFNVQATNHVATTTLTTVETNRVWINVTDTQGAFSQTLMGYRSGATDGYDHALDGAFMNDGAISLASLIGTDRYAIQFKGLPFVPTDLVQLSFKATYSGTFTFNIDHMDGFFTTANFGVYIHDTVTNTYANLKAGGYTFTSAVGTFNNRFELTYSNPSASLGVDANAFSASNLVVYQDNASIVINSGTVVLKDIALYTINGQLLYQNHQANASQATINADVLAKQPLIIKVTTQDGITVAKKWLY